MLDAGTEQDQRRPVTETPVMRSFRLPSSANAGKLTAVIALLPLWRAGLERSQAVIRLHLFTTGNCPAGWTPKAGTGDCHRDSGTQ